MKLPVIQDVNLRDKIVLLRVDHNVVKKGLIKDPFRIDASLGTIKYILENGGHPIIMTHVGRPRDKKTGKIDISEKTSVDSIVNYLEFSLNKKIEIPEILQKDEYGISSIDIQSKLRKLREGRLDCIYLPNTRWFQGEETNDEKTIQFGLQLVEFCDIFVNDAFGSWQPHASTMEPTKHLPSYAGLLMQQEIDNLEKILNPVKPFVAVIAGSKFDTKIGPLTALMNKADHLLLGGVIYNAYLCAKYNIKIKGISEEDIISAEKFINSLGELSDKVVEIPTIIESDYLDRKEEGHYRTLKVDEITPGTNLNYVLDADPEAFENKLVGQSILEANTIFVNAVMGLTPNFSEGTTAAYKLISNNVIALKLFGGGDTLQEFRTLLPGIYNGALTDDRFYFFTGGGTILKVVQEGSPFDLAPVKAILE